MSMMSAEETAAEATTTLQRMEQRSREVSMYQCIGVMNDIIATHLPGPLYINARSLLQIVADILTRTTRRHATEIVPLDLDILSSTTEDDMLKLLAKDIRRIRNELLCYYDDTEDRQEADMAHALFKAVSRYPWEAKVVMVLAGFAVNYGDDWLNAQLYTTNSLAQSILFLKQLPDITSSHSRNNNPKLIELLEHIDNLIKAMLRIINTVIEFSELPQGYISVDDSNSMSRASELIYNAVYWTVRGVMVCASKFNGLLLPDAPEGHVMESWKYSIPPLDHKIDRIHSNLRREIDNCHQEIEDKKRIQVHETLAKLFRTTQAYNMTALKVLLCSMNDSPLVDGSTNTRVGVEVLKRKTVMLLISDLDITLEEVLVLEQIYKDVHLGQSQRPYEVVWLPVLNQVSTINNGVEQDIPFRRLQSSMPWYSLYHPSLLHTGVIKYIKQQWHFDKKPIIVVLDPQGKVTCLNAIHMMWIWGITAYPFTKIREENLWMEEKWTLEFLIDGIDPSILNWMRDEKFVCLYGGEDINWIREFTSTMRRIAQEAKIPLEMVYVGKSNPKEQVKKNVNIIMKEKLSQSWQDLMSIWFFWVRLESMWYSKMQYNRTIDNDPMMREITRMLTFDGSNDGWAVIGNGTGEMAKAHGNKIIQVLGNFSEWKKDIQGHGFMQALINALSSYLNPEHCSCLVLPGSQGNNHELSCAECGRRMDQYILYRCCND